MDFGEHSPVAQTRPYRTAGQLSLYTMTADVSSLVEQSLVTSLGNLLPYTALLTSILRQPGSAALPHTGTLYCKRRTHSHTHCLTNCKSRTIAFDQMQRHGDEKTMQMIRLGR